MSIRASDSVQNVFEYFTFCVDNKYFAFFLTWRRGFTSPCAPASMRSSTYPHCLAETPIQLNAQESKSAPFISGAWIKTLNIKLFHDLRSF